MGTGAAIAVLMYQLPSAAYLHGSGGIVKRQLGIGLPV